MLAPYLTRLADFVTVARVSPRSPSPPTHADAPLPATGRRPGRACGGTFVIALLMLVSLLTGGCGSGRMIPGYSVAPVDARKARVVFMRPSFVGGAINFP